MSFFFAAAVLTAITVVAITWPLLRDGGRRAVTRRRDADLNVYRDQLREIDADEARGIIAEAEAKSARVEVSRRLLKADASGSDGVDASPKGSRIRAIAAFAAAAFIPIATLASYLPLGAPQTPDQPRAARLQIPLDQLTLPQLVQRLEATLQKRPDDARGWDLLAPLYIRLGRYPDAVAAFDRAIKLNSASPVREKGLADALVARDRGVVGDRALALYQSVAKAEPNRFDAAFWIAIANEQRGDFDAAKSAFERLREKTQPGTRGRNAVEERLAAIAARQRVAQAAGPNADDVKAAEALPPDAQMAMIRNMVAGLDERLGTTSTDLDGWKRLMRAYMVLGDREKAASVLSRAQAALSENADALDAIKKSARALGLVKS
ncbi:MAG: c-type cytochrome biogenesis protein CcmI [Pseudomonadota bacterium]